MTRLSLVRVDDLLGPVLAAAPLAPARRVALSAAVGRWLAAPVIAPARVPATAVALRTGLAVRSLDLVGASAQAPVMLDAPPVAVRLGDPLPAGCDAVIDPAALWLDGPWPQIAEAVEPGAAARLAGHDARAGGVLVAAGERLTAERAWALAEAGIATVETRAATVSLDWPEGPSRPWLLAFLERLGCERGTPEEAIVHIAPASADTAPRLALQPGATGWVSAGPRGITVALSPRFDGVVAGAVALLLPLVARINGAAIARRDVVLTRKVTSRIGATALALFSIEGERAEPVGVGDLTLAALARANAFALLSPDTEGFAGGARITVTGFEAPLSALSPGAAPATGAAA
jgi:molybdopterin biosynthesis enzyme